ncbi:5-deoxy-glucuronate isomerase [Spiroplasma eriocheiris]|uniref:5-deoxy-glucuronate isomerase n=1 Tax=Spiroplasma eriocheiris TaxID=315358 RepID=UPI00069CF416|nr:5-deoxy-glucuronate isomerase [Spiroplasma eriocheiris]
MKTYYAIGIKEYSQMNSQELRENFLISNLFINDEFNIYYTHYDRNVIIGCKPVSKEIVISDGKVFNQPYFLSRREMGIINLGGTGRIEVDGQKFELAKTNALYIPMGAKQISFSSITQNDPALFYINCAPAHQGYQIKK